MASRWNDKRDRRPRRPCTLLARFRRGITNPKSIAFFTAFLPQFLDPTLPVERHLLVMCVCSVVLGSLLDAGWAIASGLGRVWFLKPKHNRLLGRISGLVLISGGIWLSLQRRPG